MKRLIKNILLIIVIGSFSACSDLDVVNINDPSIKYIYSSPEGIRALAGSLFQSWFFSEQHNLYSPGPAMLVMSDWGTVTFANYATLDASTEPRISINNSPTYAYHENFRNYWRNMYGVVTTANDVLKILDAGMKIGTNGSETAMVRGMAHFMQGLGNGYIGLVYDKGYPSDEKTDKFEQQAYTKSIDMAVEQLEKAIVIFDTNTFTLPAEWINGNAFTNQDMSKLAHSFIARLLVYSARNKAENDATNWQKVLDHSLLGITLDFSIMGDGNITGRKWMSWYKYYLARPTWGKVDMRIVHKLDNTQPEHWTDAAPTFYPIDPTDSFPDGGFKSLPNGGYLRSGDARATTDFQFNNYNLRPERGVYRWSSIRYSRLDTYFNDNFFAPVVMMRKAENDLFIAEAFMQLGKYEQAAAVINAGTRVTRGGLAAVEATKQALDEAIFYERSIELPLTGMGIEFFDMRRCDLLQAGSMLHFPIPAQQLEIMGLEFYNFGGLESPKGIAGVDYSVDGWYKP